MNKFSVVLSLLCLLCGGMAGYSVAYGKIYQQLKAQKQQNPLPPKESPSPLAVSSDESLPFGLVIKQSSGRGVLPLDSVCAPIVDAIAKAADTTMKTLNRPDSPLLGLRRINEASRHFEDSLLSILDSHPDLSCRIPQTKEGKTQRSGYPDLEITHRPTGRTFYLDPKLYEKDSEDSSLRSFYYTHRRETSKILKPAHHLLIGFAHDGNDGQWHFQSWKIVDLSKTQLKLKSEFNASNRDLYQPDSVVRESVPELK